MQKRDTLALMPTGGGKSITFQVPGLAMPGICIVVSPLIALMRDQVDNLRSRGIKAVAIHSALSHYEIDVALDNCIYGGYKFLYLSPERLGTDLFKARLANLDVNLLAIDEAHCISQWGYDFRPSYLEIAKIREELPDVPVLALTATATPAVAEDIQEKLGFKKKNIIRQSFERKNLAYQVIQTEDKDSAILDLLRKQMGSGIIYVRSRKKTREVSDLLKKNKISADYYHAGLDSNLRLQREKNWQKGETRIMVSTNAFGMGIDKADVRLVIHIDLPDSPEAYFQEAGRAGRDGKKSFAVLLYHPSDKRSLVQSLKVKFPGLDTIRKVYKAIGHYFQLIPGSGKGQVFDFNLGDFCLKFGFHTLTAYHALKHIERAGFIELTDEINLPARLFFRVNRDDLYKFQVANALLDDFIKLILRSYTGLFNGYVNIDEELLASRAGIDQERVYTFLKHLRKSKIIDYVPRKRTPFIYFNKERISVERLRITRENYDLRKKDYRGRVEAVIHYATCTTTCRSQLLLQYFGESDSPECGICDVCQSFRKMGMSSFEFDEISKGIKEILETPCNYETLLLKQEGNREKMMEVIKWLMDNGKIVYRVDSKLEWSD